MLAGGGGGSSAGRGKNRCAPSCWLSRNGRAALPFLGPGPHTPGRLGDGNDGGRRGWDHDRRRDADQQSSNGRSRLVPPEEGYRKSKGGGGLCSVGRCNSRDR